MQNLTGKERINKDLASTSNGEPAAKKAKNVLKLSKFYVTISVNIRINLFHEPVENLLS